MLLHVIACYPFHDNTGGAGDTLPRSAGAILRMPPERLFRLSNANAPSMNRRQPSIGAVFIRIAHAIE
jgi:hypothetical protein